MANFLFHCFKRDKAQLLTHERSEYPYYRVALPFTLAHLRASVPDEPVASCEVDTRLPCKAIVEALSLVSPEDRLAVFAEFCRFCGDDDPQCQCGRDE